MVGALGWSGTLTLVVAVFLSVALVLAALSLAASARAAARHRQKMLEKLKGRTGAGAESHEGARVALFNEEARDVASRVVAKMRFGRHLARVLDAGASRVTPGAYGVRMLTVGFVFSVLAGLIMQSVIAALAGLFAGAWVMYAKAKRAAKKRIAKFDEGFPDAIDLLARALLAGHPPSAGLKMVADECQDPIRSEFKQMFEEQRYGMSMAESMQRFAERMQRPDVHIFVSAVLVQLSIGGTNLAEVLGNISGTIRERFVIRRQVLTYTAQGRMTGLMLGLMPVVLGIVIYLINPENMSLFFTDPRGKMMLGGAIAMQLTGLAIIRKIVDIDI